MKTTDFDYFLPEDRIAVFPAPQRDASRLLCIGRRGGPFIHSHFARIAELLPPRALIVLNDTRVIPARLLGRKPTGGAVELLLTRPRGEATDGAEMEWEGLGRNLGWTKVGTQLTFDAPERDMPGGVYRGDGDIDADADVSAGGAHGTSDAASHRLVAELISRGDAGAVTVRLRAEGGGSVMGALEHVGRLPLPPYIEMARRQRSASNTLGAPDVCQNAPGGISGFDRERYQTVFATSAGAVAAPTAGLHFTQELLRALEGDGHQLASLTLHVGPGTFRPVKTEAADAHEMDAETYTIPPTTAVAVSEAKQSGRPVVAVGTTVVRALESAARARKLGEPLVSAGTRQSRLFLRPPSDFHVVTDLITNFHLPRSTLLMLVSAFAGRERTLAAYAEAIASGYRFYSYGDAMLIRGSEPKPQ